jgi:hypothetical protein
MESPEAAVRRIAAGHHADMLAKAAAEGAPKLETLARLHLQASMLMVVGGALACACTLRAYQPFSVRLCLFCSPQAARPPRGTGL